MRNLPARLVPKLHSIFYNILTASLYIKFPSVSDIRRFALEYPNVDSRRRYQHAHGQRCDFAGFRGPFGSIGIRGNPLFFKDFPRYWPTAGEGRNSAGPNRSIRGGRRAGVVYRASDRVNGSKGVGGGP